MLISRELWHLKRRHLESADILGVQTFETQTSWRRRHLECADILKVLTSYNCWHLESAHVWNVDHWLCRRRWTVGDAPSGGDRTTAGYIVPHYYTNQMTIQKYPGDYSVILFLNWYHCIYGPVSVSLACVNEWGTLLTVYWGWGISVCWMYIHKVRHPNAVLCNTQCDVGGVLTCAFVVRTLLGKLLYLHEAKCMWDAGQDQ